MRRHLQIFISIELVIILVAMVGLAGDVGSPLFKIGFACAKLGTFAAIAALLFLGIWHES